MGSNQRDEAIKLIVKKAKNEKNKHGPRALYLWEEAYEISKDMETDLKIEILEALGSIYFSRGDNDKLLKLMRNYMKKPKIDDFKHAIAQLGLGEIYFQI